VWSPYPIKPGSGDDRMPLFSGTYLRQCEEHGIPGEELEALADRFIQYDPERTGWIPIKDLVPLLRMANESWGSDDLAGIADLFRSTSVRGDTDHTSILSLVAWWAELHA